MLKNVLVTGATGFTGKYVVEELCRSGYQVTCFIRESSDRKRLSYLPVNFITGELVEPESLCKALGDKDALVNVASLGFGHAPGIVRACTEAGVKRAVFFSTTALFTTLPAATKAVRAAAEQTIQESKLDYTILRPTMIYGSIHDRNMVKLISFIDRNYFIPVFGDGKSLQQPVFVRDLAKAVTGVLAKNRTIRREYNLSGQDPLTYNDVIDTVAKTMGKRVFKIHLPVSLSLLLIRCASFVPGLPKFSSEQIFRLNENKVFSHQDAKNDFGYDPCSFENGIRLEIEEYFKNK